MTLHGGPISPFVRKAGIAIIEKGMEAQVRFVRSFTAMLKANSELQQLNPLSKIPTLVTSRGVALFDSDVICEYVDSAHPPATLFPASGEERWQALRWNALGSGALDTLVLWRFECNRPSTQQSPEALETFATKIEAVLRLIEREMPVIEAAHFGIGHIPIGCMYGYLDFRFPSIDWRAAHPRSADWFSDFTQRPSAIRTTPYEQGTAHVPTHLWPSPQEART